MEEPQEGEEEITEVQRKRMEANREAALAKRKAIAGNNDDNNNSSSSSNSNPNQFHSAWKLFKCRKLSSERTNTGLTKPIYPFVKMTSIPKPPLPLSTPPLTEKFRVRFEISSPDSFSITPEPVAGFAFPGEEACLEKISHWLSNVEPSHYTQNNEGGRASVFKLREYVSVLRSLKNCEGIECEEIPWGTFKVVEKISDSHAYGKWETCRPEYLPEVKVDELIRNLPQKLLDALLPFQLEGVQFGLRRGGRCLIADEMGLGKTLQAIAIAGCFRNEGSVLIVCPAILRFSWADELERWFPFCLPSDIHLVFCHQDNPANLTKCPKIVVISYKMLHHLRKSMLQREWATLIVDESHHLRCSKKKSEPEEIKSVLDVATKVKHLILLSGTPSLSRLWQSCDHRPFDIFHQINMLWSGLLGRTKYDFATTYCSPKFVPGCQGKVFQDFSKGIRLEELNVLLKQTVMIRRLKHHVLAQLPPIRRQIMRLALRKSDIASAMATLGLVLNGSEFASGMAALGMLDSDASAVDTEDEPSEHPIQGRDKSSSLREIVNKEDQILGIAKLSGFFEWLSIHPIFTGLDVEEATEASLSSQKMIIFAHHHNVCDRIQEYLWEKGIEFIRINSYVSSSDRQKAVQSFQSSNEVKIAIIGILAGGVGLNLTAANNVVFLELPKEISYMNQAESRAHRLGQTKAVNIYVFCAKGTSDESRWQKLNRSLFQVSSIMNGKHAAIAEIKVETVSDLNTTGGADERNHELAVEAETSSAVSAENLTIHQSSCHTQDQRPIEDYHDSCKMVNNGTVTQDRTAVLCQVESLQSQATPSLKCRKSAIEAITYTAGRISSRNSEDRKGEDEVEKVSTEEEIAVHNRGSCQQMEDSATSSIPVTSLRFEVSHYTGRIHLYSCIPGRDSRPQPLFLSFRPQEVESIELLSEDGMKSAKKCIEDYQNYQCALLSFLKEWKQLRPIERMKLLLKPLQLPLSVELCYLAESLNHDKGGLLKGGSKRRSTPLDEISKPLPPNAIWRKVCLRSGRSKKEKMYRQGWSPMEEPLCKFCQTPCLNDNAKSPEYFEDLFCNLGCYEEFGFRTNTKSLRQALFQVEHGICTSCQLDCHGLVQKLKPLSFENRQEFIKKAAPELAKHKKLFDKLVQDPTEGNAWHADHLIPVYQGGGECSLENMRTLCVSCHAGVTAAQCAERRMTRAEAKRHLKVTMNNLKNLKNLEEIGGKLEGQQQLETEESMAEKELLVEVPGSAYSGPRTNTTMGSREDET